jgi:hypothetical protein
MTTDKKYRKTLKRTVSCGSIPERDSISWKNLGEESV